MKPIATNGDAVLWVADDVDPSLPEARGTMKKVDGTVVREDVAVQAVLARGYWESIEVLEERKQRADKAAPGPRVSIETAAEVLVQALTGEWTFQEALVVLRDAAEEGL